MHCPNTETGTHGPNDFHRLSGRSLCREELCSLGSTGGCRTGTFAALHMQLLHSLCYACCMTPHSPVQQRQTAPLELPVGGLTRVEGKIQVRKRREMEVRVQR